MPNYEEILKSFQSIGKGNIGDYLGMEFTELSEGYMSGKIPVDHRTVQPLGVLHGGVSLVLAETLGTLGAISLVSNDKTCVGLEINGNHIKSVKSGYITGKAKCKHNGKTTQIWEVNIFDDDENLVCLSRITLAVIDKVKR